MSAVQLPFSTYIIQKLQPENEDVNIEWLVSHQLTQSRQSPIPMLNNYQVSTDGFNPKINTNHHPIFGEMHKEN